MILTLDVTGPEDPKRATRKEIRSTNGTIGRTPGSSVELADPHVSRVHALVHYSGGAFYLENKSQVGTFLNASQLENGRRYPLQTGDLIVIDPYEIRVWIASDAQAENAFGPLGLDQAETLDPFLEIPALEEEVDPLKALGGQAPPRPGPVSRAPSLQQIPPERESYVPPPVVEPRPAPIPPRADMIPQDFDELLPGGKPSAPGAGAGGESAPPPASEPRRPAPSERPSARRERQQASRPAPHPPAQGRGASDSDLAQVLIGAGLRPEDVTPELARDFGRILHVVVAGLMDVLQARQKTKEEFRLGATSFKPAGNNPLKFSANVEDALHNLLVKRNKAYLGPVEAFEDAFDDVRHHQVAMLAGVRVAFEAMLAQFDPDRLQERFDRQKKGALVSVPAKLRYWDLYRDWIHDMVRDAEGSFRELFGDEFAEAYEEQLKALKGRGRSREP
jgi:type VI secretion system FHA domain protein